MKSQVEIFKLFLKDTDCVCFYDILVKIKELSEPEKSMINHVITICNLILVNPAASASGERSFSAARRSKTWLRSTMSQQRFNNLTTLNWHKDRTDKLSLLTLPTSFVNAVTIEGKILIASSNRTVKYNIHKCALFGKKTVRFSLS